MHQAKIVARLLVVATVATALGAATAVVFSFPDARAATPVPLFEEVDTLERFPPDAREALGANFVPEWDAIKELGTSNQDLVQETGTVIAIPEVRQLWQLYRSKNPQGMAVVVRDLDTLDIVRTLRLPAVARREVRGAGGGGGWAHAIDPVGKRLFLVTTADLSVLEVDLESFSIVVRPLPGSAPVLPRVPTTPPVPLVVGGTTYDPWTGSLLFLYGGPPSTLVANTNTFLYTLDVRGSPGGALAGRFTQVRSCTAALTSTDLGDDNYNWEVLVTERYLYVPCQRSGHTGIVVRMTRPTAADPVPTETSAAGPVYVENALADQASGRIVMTNYLDKEIWTFEAATMSFVGIAATSPSGNRNFKTGFGLDRATGRVFFQSPGFGLGVVEGRFFPLPQARRADHRSQGQERIFSDARTNRIFVLEGYSTSKTRAYHIYRTIPAPPPPPPPDPDRNTVDMAEQPGVTEARYNATASGYGARMVWARGLYPVVPAPAAGVNAPTADLLQNPHLATCGFTDREVAAGRVYKAEYDTGSAAAEAAAAELDGATKQDLDKFGHCDTRAAPLDPHTQADDPKTERTHESRWRWGRASCSSSEGRPGEASGATTPDKTTKTSAGFGPSAVSCPEPGGVLTASATARLEGNETSTGRAWTTTTIERRPGGGVRSVVESVAQDIRITLPGVATVTFAEVRSRAASIANGRPPTDGPMSSHEVVVRGARLNGKPLCDGEECRDLTGLVDTLNTVLAGRAQFRTGAGDDSGLDRALAKGSTKGAQTGVQKSQARQASDRSLTGDFTVEVPALEVTTFNDNTKWGRARQLYQFAGVASAVTYNIVLRPAGEGLPDLGPFEGTFGNLGGGDAALEAPFSAVAFDEGDSESPLEAVSVVAHADDDRGGFWTPVRAVARGLRLFLTDPRHALLLLTAWALLGLPGALSHRRRLLAGTRSS